ncbi:hypothetical protein [Bradyrhizobium huanghuaihaiense]
MHWYDVQQLEEAAAIEAEQEQRAAAQERRTTILSSMFASGERKGLAEHLADSTDMTPDQAEAVLRIANQATSAKVPSRVGIGAFGVLDNPRSVSAPTSFNELAANVYASRKAKTR